MEGAAAHCQISFSYTLLHYLIETPPLLLPPALPAGRGRVVQRLRLFQSEWREEPQHISAYISKTDPWTQVRVKKFRNFS
jgi:hypothetical protein